MKVVYVNGLDYNRIDQLVWTTQVGQPVPNRYVERETHILSNGKIRISVVILIVDVVSTHVIDGAERGTRTLTPLQTTDFKSGASTNSAIPAKCVYIDCSGNPARAQEPIAEKVALAGRVGRGLTGYTDISVVSLFLLAIPMIL